MRSGLMQYRSGPLMQNQSGVDIGLHSWLSKRADFVFSKLSSSVSARSGPLPGCWLAVTMGAFAIVDTPPPSSWPALFHFLW